MSEAKIVLPALTSAQLTILWCVLASAVVSLAYGWWLVQVVLKADPGPKSMTDVADAIAFAIAAPIAVNIGHLEITPTLQVPGGLSTAKPASESASAVQRADCSSSKATSGLA